MHSQTVTTLTAESIALFQSSLYAKGRSERTVRAYSTDLRVLLQEVGQTAISKDEMEMVGSNWLTANRQKVAFKTTGRRLTSLRAWCKWAGWGDLFADYSAPTPLPGDPHPLPEGMEGVDRLIAAADRPEHKILAALCGRCGLRVAEALEVRPSWFDTEEMVLRVVGKGSKERLIPISPEAWEVFCGPLTKAFVLGSNEPLVGLKDRYARKMIGILGRKAGLKREVASHDLRATFATAVYDKTKDIRVVQILLGHASSATTEIYVGRSMQQMRDAVKGL